MTQVIMDITARTAPPIPDKNGTERYMGFEVGATVEEVDDDGVDVSAII